jgi:putative membrane protein
MTLKLKIQQFGCFSVLIVTWFDLVDDERSIMMSRFILRWAINAIALYVAVASSLVPGVQMTINPQSGGNTWLSLIWLALIFGLINALFRPLLKLLTCPLIMLTLGLFTLVVNTLLFAFTGWVGMQLGVGFTLSEPWFWNAFLGSLIVSLVSLVLTLLLKDELKPRKKKTY